MLATLVIFLREGVEASMIIAILLAYLNRSGQRRHFRDVFAGVTAAMVLAAAGGIVAYLTIKTYADSRVQIIFETATFLLAAVLLTYMTFWMRSHARGLKSELQSRADAVLAGHGERAADPVPAPSKAPVTVPASTAELGPAPATPAPGASAADPEPMSRGARAGLALLAFQAVGREGVETVVFTLAIAFSSTQKGGLLAGGAIGMAIALVIAFVMYKLGHRINIGRFFTIVGVLLMVFAAGLLVDAVQNLQELGWLPGGAHQLWHTGSVLSEDSALGDVAHSFLGYAQSPTVLQAVVYLVYLACVLFVFLGIRQRLTARRSGVG
jgi:high-affinity iron transporter